jgi:uncharacterized protein (DUF1778 family)
MAAMSDAQRTERITVRLTPAERDRITQAADAAKRKPSDYLRTVGIEDADRSLTAIPRRNPKHKAP